MPRHSSVAALVSASAIALVVAGAVVSATYEFRFDGATTRLLAEDSASAGTWGTVCDDSFTSTTATGMCVLLGWSYVATASFATVGGGAGSVALSTVACSASPSSFTSSCTFVAGAGLCTHAQDVGITCSGVRDGGLFGVYAGSASGANSYLRLTSPLRRLEIRTGHTTTWGTICDDGFTDQTATKICSWFGFSTGSYYTAGGGAGTIMLDNVVCPSSATSLSGCSQTTLHNCVHNEDVGLRCIDATQGSLTGDYFIKQEPGTNRLLARVANSSAAYSGSSPVWGSVCDDLFNPTTALRVCRFMGYTGSSASYATASTPSTGAILIDDLSCSSAAVSLSQCTGRFGSHDCANAEDVTVTCNNVIVTTSSKKATDPLVGIIIGSVLGGLVLVAAIAVVYVQYCVDGESDGCCDCDCDCCDCDCDCDCDCSFLRRWFCCCFRRRRAPAPVEEAPSHTMHDAPPTNDNIEPATGAIVHAGGDHHHPQPYGSNFGSVPVFGYPVVGAGMPPVGYGYGPQYGYAAAPLSPQPGLPPPGFSVPQPTMAMDLPPPEFVGGSAFDASPIDQSKP